jgi:hypothetical protein
MYLCKRLRENDENEIGSGSEKMISLLTRDGMTRVFPQNSDQRPWILQRLLFLVRRAKRSTRRDRCGLLSKEIVFSCHRKRMALVNAILRIEFHFFVIFVPCR